MTIQFASPLPRANWSDWTDALQADYFYTPAQIETGLDFLAVYRDEGRKAPLLLLTSSDRAGSGALQLARQRGFPLVGSGTPTDVAVHAVGQFDSDHSTAARLPTWMPRHPRQELVSRTVELLPFPDEAGLRSAFQACHDVIYKSLANDPAATFDLVLLTLAAKVLDELGPTDGRYDFGAVDLETTEARAERFRRLLVEAEAWLDGHGASTGSVPRVSPAVAESLTHILQDYSLTLTADSAAGTDIVGTAYEAIVGATFRGELGSYFTPRTVADFIAGMLDPDAKRVFDPACGSAGLLLALHRSRGEEQRRSMEYFGNDLNPRMVRAAKVNFLLHGLNPSNVLEGNGLEIDRLLRDTVGYEVGAAGAWWEAIPNGPFDAVVANPPFAGHEDDHDLLKRIDSARKQNGELRSLNRTLPFVESIVAMLREGGMAALVLPTSILNAEEDSFVRLRTLLMEHTEVTAIIGLPEKAFVHTDCGIHGVLLFLTRAARPRETYPVFVDWAQHLGYDRLGRFRRENDFPAIVSRFRSPSWPEKNSFSSEDLRQASRWDPAWLSVTRSLPTQESGDYVPLGQLLEVREARFSRRELNEDDAYRFFEVADTDLITGSIVRVQEANGFELKKKGRIKNRVQGGDLLLPNHRDSLIAKGAPTGRSAVLVEEAHEGLLTTDRFLVLRPLIDARLLRVILNSAGVRRQIVAQCRGAASLDIRERTLQAVLVPTELATGATGERIKSSAARIKDLRAALADEQANLAEMVELPFGVVGDDFRPAGWASL